MSFQVFFEMMFWKPRKIITNIKKISESGIIPIEISNFPDPKIDCWTL